MERLGISSLLDNHPRSQVLMLCRSILAIPSSLFPLTLAESGGEEILTM